MTMIPAGYMAKRVIPKPEHIKSPVVVDIISVSGCQVKNFADYINFWKHNGFWLFDSPDVIRQLAKENEIDLEGTSLFYFEVYPMEYQTDVDHWREFKPEPSFGLNVQSPKKKTLEGFDVVSFSCGNSPECSPLLCESLADEIPVNSHGLIPSFDEAKALLERGELKNSEPGPYRIFAVYSLGDR